MSPDDPRHGTNAGHRAHYSANEKPCRPCMDAHAAYKRNREARLYLNRVEKLSVPSWPSTRRIRALQAIGWPLHLIDQHLGHGDGRDKGGPNYVWNLMARDVVRIDTAKKVAALYDRLCMTPGPSNRARLNALAKGWAPPLAWDNIDDPDERPAEPEKVDGRKTVDRVIEDVEWLADGNANLTEVIARLDINRNTLRDLLRREDRDDLYWRLANREPDADSRRAVRDGIKRAKEVA